MNRVVPYAKKIGAETYGGPPNLLTNQAWIKSKMSQGYIVHDIGPDFARRRILTTSGKPYGSSIFYNMERQTTKGYNFYIKEFIRNGKYDL